jgi:hypothetical protein
LLKPSFSFSRALPSLAFLTALLLVGSVLPGMIRVHKTIANRTITNTSAIINPLIIEEMVRESKSETRRSLPNPLELSTLLNMPAFLVEIAISLPTTWPDSWHPRLPFPFDDLWFWRAISWPIYALPLWWLAGRGIDGLSQPEAFSVRLRIRLVEVIFMGVIGVLSGIIGIGLFLTAESDNSNDPLKWAVVPCLLWLSFGLVSVIAWIRQKRLTV